MCGDVYWCVCRYVGIVVLGMLETVLRQHPFYFKAACVAIQVCVGMCIGMCVGMCVGVC